MYTVRMVRACKYLFEQQITKKFLEQIIFVVFLPDVPELLQWVVTREGRVEFTSPLQLEREEHTLTQATANPMLYIIT